MDKVESLCADITQSCSVREAALLVEAHVEGPPLPDPNPYGDTPGCDPVHLVLQIQEQGPLVLLTPSAPPEHMNHQTLRVEPSPQDQSFDATRMLGTPCFAGAQTGVQHLEEVEHRARHLHFGNADDRNIDMHHDRWMKVDQQNRKEMPTDQDENIFK